ncbi:MAG TPA: 30S ribosomal protein S3ae, partial [Candidatus Methanomethylia archaeon]|nr:30S ribosomal protein S3ae [Candidatus Methanomethylicia archaeon]
YRKAEQLNFEEFIQQAVLGKIASEVYNEAKKIHPLRKVEVFKTELLKAPILEELQLAA